MNAESMHDFGGKATALPVLECKDNDWQETRQRQTRRQRRQQRRRQLAATYCLQKQHQQLPQWHKLTINWCFSINCTLQLWSVGRQHKVSISFWLLSDTVRQTVIMICYSQSASLPSDWLEKGGHSVARHWHFYLHSANGFNRSWRYTNFAMHFQVEMVQRSTMANYGNGAAVLNCSLSWSFSRGGRQPLTLNKQLISAFAVSTKRKWVRDCKKCCCLSYQSVAGCWAN